MGILDKIFSLFSGKKKQRKFESFIDEDWEKWAERSYYYGMKKLEDWERKYGFEKGRKTRGCQ